MLKQVLVQVLIALVIAAAFWIIAKVQTVSVGLVIPVGAVIAFDATECPAGGGWKPYQPAYGRFIRGIDASSDSIDPSGKRTPGSLQGDSNRSHTHKSLHKVMVHTQNGGPSGEDLDPGGWAGHMQIDIAADADGGPESRPKNVALLYCIKT